jgi:hypothetical protein
MRPGCNVEYLNGASLFGGTLVLMMTRVDLPEGDGEDAETWHAIELFVRGSPDVIKRMILKKDSAGGYDIDDVIQFASDLTKAAQDVKERMNREV